MSQQAMVSNVALATIFSNFLASHGVGIFHRLMRRQRFLTPLFR
jgi:hypothetical protein